MADSLLLHERVKNTIQLGESHFREFKSALEGPEHNKKPRLTKKICTDIGEALVAFANADGGELLVGIEDNGFISGIPHSTEDINQMLAAPETHVHPDSVLPLSTAAQINLEGKIVLFFSVMKGTTEVYQLPDGRCVRRKDKSTMPETVTKILFDRQEVRSREYDRNFVDGATVSDLDVQFVQNLANEYLRGLSVERYLQQIGVAEYAMNGLRLRMAALLLFAKDIQRWHPRSQVRILRVAGTEIESGERYNAISDESVQGNIFDLVVKSWEKLRPFLAYKTEFGSDAKFEQKYIYPELACREALVNAIAHRDYGIHNGIDVFIFDDRMEIKSPGALLSTITVQDLEELRGAHESRNALIARVLRENNLMRELGEGMKRMFELMEQSELDQPKLHTDKNSFRVTLPHKSVFTARQEQWLLMFQQFNLTTLQKKIMVLGMEDREISPADIYKAMNTNDRNTYDNEVTALRKAQILIEIRTNPAATNYARSNKIPKSEVPRFKVQIPGMAVTAPAATRKPKPAPKLYQTDPDRCVFLTNLPQNITTQEVNELFGSYGQVERVDLPIDHETGTLRGFGFVCFEASQSAREVIQQLNGYEIRGRLIVVKKYTPRK